MLYKYQDLYVEEMPYFLYEVSLYRIEKNRANLLCNKYYKTNKLLKIKEHELVRCFNNISIERFITLLGVPFEFIKENRLQSYEKRTR